MEKTYQCVGICIFDPVDGHCLGCGRPAPSIPTNEEIKEKEEKDNLKTKK